MERISIDNGLKSFEIADNEGNVRGVISFNPSDFGFIERAKKVRRILSNMPIQSRRMRQKRPL